MAAWFKWTLTGNIQYHCMQDDSLYVVVRNNSKDQLLKYSIRTDANTVQLLGDRIHLDHIMPTSGWTYDSSTGKSTKAKPLGLESSNQLAAYDIDGTNSIGNYALVTVNGSNLEIIGDWSGQSFYIGYLYELSLIHI